MEEQSGTATVARPVYESRTACRACGSALSSVLDLGLQYLPRFVAAPDPTLPCAPLLFCRCSGCGLLQLGHTIDPDLLYREFWYRSAVNETMREALRSLVSEATGQQADGRWLDIGANDGYLLQCVPRERFERIACEPALNFRGELEASAEQVVSDYFSAESCPGPFQVITSAAMFYDLNDPDRFVADIARVLATDGVWLNQLNDAPTMLRKNAFDAIVHEHACYYDVPTIAALYARHGLSITGISYNAVNGGSVRIAARRTSRAIRPISLLGHPRVTAEQAEAFAQRVLRWRGHMRRVLAMLADSGMVYGYAASTKFTALLQYLGAGDDLVAVADKNPLKHGLRMAGSWLPIVSEEEMRAANPGALLIGAWAFRDEFLEREAALRAQGAAMIFPLPNIEVVL